MGTAPAVASSLIYFALLRQHVHILQRPWCTEAWKTTDCHSEEGLGAARGNDTDLKVVLPSYGQTGTSSVTEALRVLGFRTFHADDFSSLAKPVMFDDVDWHYWAQTVSRCRMEAMSLEPVTDMLPILLAKAPKARFILTWRTFPSWLKSTSATRAKERQVETISQLLTTSNNLYPWIETLDYLTGAVKRQRLEGNPYWGSTLTASGYIYRILCNGYGWPMTRYKSRGTYKNKGSEEAYLAHVNEIRETVPQDRLFEFDIKQHSWAELEYMVFGTKSSVSRGPFPQPRSKDMRTNEPLLEKNWNVTGPAYYIFTILHALNFSAILLTLSALANGLRLLLSASELSAEPEAAKPHPGPGADRAAPEATSAGGKAERWEAALESSPVVALLEGLEPGEAVAVGRALAEAGVHLLAVPLPAQGALQSLRLLAGAVPRGTVVGASCVLTENEVCAVHQAGGSFVLSPNTDPKVIQRTKGLGLAALPGVTSPSEAFSALRLGADGLNAFPAEQMPPSTIKALCAVLPRGVRILATGTDAPDDMAGYWAAGVRGFGATAELFRPGDAPDLVRLRAGAFLEACLKARPGARPS